MSAFTWNSPISNITVVFGVLLLVVLVIAPRVVTVVGVINVFKKWNVVKKKWIFSVCLRLYSESSQKTAFKSIFFQINTYISKQY